MQLPEMWLGTAGRSGEQASCQKPVTGTCTKTAEVEVQPSTQPAPIGKALLCKAGVAVGLLTRPAPSSGLRSVVLPRRIKHHLCGPQLWNQAAALANSFNVFMF